jgi:hypothetical protein
LVSLVFLACLAEGFAAEPPIPRDFDFALPLFDLSSAWNQTASTVPVLPSSEAQIAVTFGVLCGNVDDQRPPGLDPLNFPYLNTNYDEFAIPIFRAGSGQQSVLMCDYEGNLQYPGPKWPVNEYGGTIQIPNAAVPLRPAPPPGIESDGHLVLFDTLTGIEYEFWQATTIRNGDCGSAGAGLIGSQLLEAGAADFFDVDGPGTNPDDVSSARAMGTPLLAGLLLPEDVASGSIDHALAVAIPGPRNLSPFPEETLPSEWMYPASTTETDFYSVNPNALIAGQRLRMRSTLVDDAGSVINENNLLPITRMLIQSLRDYGAYVVDNAGAFTFYAEDVGTANIDLTDAQVNALVGEPSSAPLPVDKTRWQILMEALSEEIWQIPIAYGICNGSSSTVITTNFDVVELAVRGIDVLIFRNGFEDGRRFHPRT